MAAALLPPTNTSLRASPQTTQSLIEATLDNITNLNRPGQDGYATVWDGNKYVQCRRLADRRTLRQRFVAIRYSHARSDWPSNRPIERHAANRAS